MLKVRESLCSGCGVCLQVCPVDAIHLQEGRAQIDQALCDECGACIDVCPVDAILVVLEPAEVILTPEVAAVTRTAPEATPSKEIITVQIPPSPAVVEPAPSLAKRAVPIVGATLTWLGREIGSKLVRLAADLIEDRLARSGTATSMRGPGTPSSGRTASGGTGRRLRRRRHGRS